MTRGLNARELARLAQVFGPGLRGARCTKVRTVEADPLAICMEFATDSVPSRWVLSASPTLGRWQPVAVRPESAEEPPAFVMLLRKHLEGATIASVWTVEGDRVLGVDFAQPDGSRGLRAELTGRHGNVFLLDGDGTILGSVAPNRSRKRALLPGQPWVAPAPRDADREEAVREGWPEEPASLATWLEAEFRSLVEAERLDEARVALDRELGRAEARIGRRLAALRGDLARIDGAAELRRQAELLAAAPDRHARGRERIAVRDWYAEGAPMREIAVDPAMSPAEVAERGFREARRLERGRPNVVARTEEAERAQARLRELRAASGAAEAMEEVSRVSVWAERTGLVSRRRAPGPRERAAAPRLAYTPFVSSDGLEILVGRGGADNDALTVRVARGNDGWMHVSDQPGAHVVVRAPRGGEIPRRTLEEAALLAAWHSKARGATVVHVTWTLRKHVRKPKGLPPGRVLIAGGRGIDARMDDPRLGALLRRGAHAPGEEPEFS